MYTVATSSERIAAHVEDGVGWITLDNPARHNALTADMFAAIRELLHTWESGDGDHAVRVVVVRGAGEKAFASGADITQLDGRMARAAAPERPPSGDAPARGPLGCDLPVLAMIHGYCIGGGLLVAMDADLRIAADDAQFGVPAGRLGVGYPYDAVRALVALVGPGAAAELLFTAERLDARGAVRVGLVDRVVAKDDLERVVRAVASTIAANAPLSLRAGKAAIRAVLRGSQPDDVGRAQAAIRAAWSSEDFSEGRQAFAERRAPVFRGR